MKYNSNSHITTVQKVEEFFHHIVTERKVNFHPDNTFEDYVSYENGCDSFTSEECSIYNQLMEESFSVCEKNGVDIYEIDMTELYTNIG